MSLISLVYPTKHIIYQNLGEIGEMPCPTLYVERLLITQVVFQRIDLFQKQKVSSHFPSHCFGMTYSKKLHIQEVHNCRLLSVTKYLMSLRNCDWQNEMQRKRFVSERKSILRNTTRSMFARKTCVYCL